MLIVPILCVWGLQKHTLTVIRKKKGWALVSQDEQDVEAQDESSGSFFGGPSQETLDSCFPALSYRQVYMILYIIIYRYMYTGIYIGGVVCLCV